MGQFPNLERHLSVCLSLFCVAFSFFFCHTFSPSFLVLTLSFCLIFFFCPLFHRFLSSTLYLSHFCCSVYLVFSAFPSGFSLLVTHYGTFFSSFPFCFFFPFSLPGQEAQMSSLSLHHVSDVRCGSRDDFLS